MSLANVIPSEIMTALFEDKLLKSLVAGNVVNTKYTGVISQFGDSVKIPTIGDISVSDHTKNSTISYATLDAAAQVLQINQAKNFAVAVDRVDEIQAIKALVPELVNRGTYELSQAADSWLIQSVMEASAGVKGGTGSRALGVAGTAVTVSASDCLQYVGRIAQRLDEENVPTDSRFMVVPPWFHNYLVQAKVLETDGSVTADDAFANGRVGRVMGFDVRVSMNLTNATASTASRILAGHTMSTTFADQLLEVSVKDLETQFGTGVRGLYVYGAKVVQEKALALGIITQG